MRERYAGHELLHVSLVLVGLYFCLQGGQEHNDLKLVLAPYGSTFRVILFLLSCWIKFCLIALLPSFWI